MTLKKEKLLTYYIKKYDINNFFNKDMTEYMEIFEMPKKFDIFKTGDKLEYLYFLVKGKVKIYFLLENGNQVLLRFITPLDILGEIELMDNLEIKNSAITTEKTILIGIKINTARDILINDNKFLLKINRILSHKLYTIDKTMALNQSYPLKIKLANYLITLQLSNEKRIKEIKTLNIQEIAQLLGCSERHLNRVIKEFCDKGILNKNGKYISIINTNHLEKLSKDSYDWGEK